MKRGTYSSEVLARTKKYRDNSYYNTPSKADDVTTNKGKAMVDDSQNHATNIIKPLTATMIITSPTVPTGTVTLEQRSILDEAE